MKSLNYILLLIIVAMCCIGSCRKPIPPKPFFPLDEEMRAYFAVPDSGSWYVYQDSASGVFDTMRVKNRRDHIIGNLPYLGEGYSLFYTCTQSPNFRTDVSTQDDGYTFSLSYSIGGAHRISKDSSGFSPREKVKILDSLVVEGVKYESVIQSADNFNYGQAYRKLWFSKGVGIVKKQAISNQGGYDAVFNLINYQIE
ncbi:MAG: hypothetical protein R3C61_23360 [Bacteroidia bacterium]